MINSALDKVNSVREWVQLSLILMLSLLLVVLYLQSLDLRDGQLIMCVLVVSVIVIGFGLCCLIHLFWPETPEMKQERREKELNKKKEGE